MSQASSLTAMTGAQRAMPVALVLGGVFSVQFGAAVATSLFDEIGPTGTVFLRVGISAVLLWVIWRPSVRDHPVDDLRLAALFGVSLAAMNLSFYEALDRIPLGIAVTLEFVGPLGVAIAASRRRRDLIWVGLAGGGILLLSPGLGGSIDALGALFALMAGGFWAGYIVLSARIGRRFEGGTGLALAMAIGTLPLIPFGIVDGGADLADGEVLLAAFGVALLSSAIPYSLELEALRSLAVGTFGVLMSLEPAMAALVGFVVLDQGLASAEVLGIALVVAASAGALGSGRAPSAAEA
jgi:inner membrane transporter RhtA